MKNALQKFFALAFIALVGLSVATPAQARWYDGHHYHHGHAPHGWVWDPRLGYYVAAPGYIVTQPGVVVAQPGYVVAQPQPAPVIVEQAPPPAVYVQPAPTYVEPAPVGVNLGVHIR